jgi:hypothetical protein
MGTLIRDLLDCFAKVDVEFIDEPDEEIGENDHVLGTCSDDAKRLYVLRDQAISSAKNIKRQIIHLMADIDDMPQGPPSKLIELHNNFQAANERTTILDKLLWATIREEFPEGNNKPSIGFRKGWQIVWTGGIAAIGIPLPPEILRKLLDAFGEGPPPM